MSEWGEDFASGEEELNRILAEQAVRIFFQPIVDLDTGGVVAYEALTRGPVGSSLEQPNGLFEAARAAGKLAELDWMCRLAASRAAVLSSLVAPRAVFINVEPESLATPYPPGLRDRWEEGKRSLHVVVEITERVLTTDPPGLLASLHRIRQLGWTVAIDDVGANPDSLALLPFIAPEVVKLDLRLIQRRPTTETAAIVHAVSAYAERTGALVLAEGIENDVHVETARAMGATLGQGWHFGRPAPGIGELPVPWRGRPSPPIGVPATPFETVTAQRGVRSATAPLLHAMSRHLEEQAVSWPHSPVVLAGFQEARRFTPEIAARYQALARHAALVGVLGADMPLEPAPGVRGGALDDDDPLLGEWAVVVVAPHFAAALVARERQAGGDGRRRFDFALTHDRPLVLAASRSLLARIARIL